MSQFSKVRLTKVSSSVSETLYTNFDALGRLTSNEQVTDGATYPMSYTYNLAGAMTSETYPSGRVVTNTFDTDGSLANVSSKANSNATPRTYANSFIYNASGAVSSMRLGNGRFESTQFNSRLQPTQIALGTSAFNTSLLKLNYDYGTTDNNGNVKQQTITVPGMTHPLIQTYAYDSLNRLQSATETSNSIQTWKQTFIYDRYGNRRFDMANTTVPDSQSNQNITNPQIDVSNNRFSANQGYDYDQSGNVTKDATDKRFAYDAENKQTSFGTNGSSTNGGSYFYDGDGRRVKKVVGTETTVFVYNASGQLVAEYTTTVPPTNPTISYLTSDILGSPRINTDANGQVTARHDYMPFGEEIISGQPYSGGRTNQLGYVGDNVRQKFTQKERDTETGLDYFLARYYSSAHGRFTSVDPINLTKKRLLDPQRINLYAYVRNNPLKFIDPKGEDVLLANDTKDSRRKALLNATATLKDSEKRNIGIRKNANGKYELYVKDPSKIDTSKASPGYQYLTQRIGDHSIQVSYTLLGKGQSVVAGDGQTYSQKGLAAGAGGVTIGLGGGKVEVIVAEGGVPNGVKGLTQSGKDVQIAFPDHLVTAHELFGETLKYAPGNQRLQGQDDATKAEDSRRVIAIENEIRDFLGVPRRSGKDHEGTLDVGTVTIRP